MIITWGLENASYNPKTITTLGSYDGMHRGHTKILDRLIAKKTDLDLDRSIVLTFDPHPQEILRRDNTNVDLLTTIEERLFLIEETGVDETLVIRFSLEFAKTPYRDFFQNVLIEKLGTKAMVVGSNHAFGKNREGDIHHLQDLASDTRTIVEQVQPLIVDGVSISSTKIRHALLEGNISIANLYLGRPYQLTGIVEEGDKLGRTLGFPTANIKVPSYKLIPHDGVYAGKAILEGNTYLCAISIGTRPTIESDGERKVEAYILDFDKNIYGKTLTIEFYTFIREQIKFDSLSDLTNQIVDDILKVRVITI